MKTFMPHSPAATLRHSHTDQTNGNTMHSVQYNIYLFKKSRQQTKTLRNSYSSLQQQRRGWLAPPMLTAIPYSRWRRVASFSPTWRDQFPAVHLNTILLLSSHV